jgi:uncharacterized protein (TIGR01244 family)
MVAVAGVVLVGGCGQTRSDALGRADGPPPVVHGGAVEGEKGVFVAGPVYFAAQPDAAQLARLRERGVATVINLRSTGEMEKLKGGEAPLDEAAEVQRLGMRYVHIPLGGDDGYEPADVEAFARAMDASGWDRSGPVLVHCASGGRARAMWQAYLVEERGYTLDEAAAVARTVGEEPTAVEKLLGRRVKQRVGGAL